MKASGSAVGGIGSHPLRAAAAAVAAVVMVMPGGSSPPLLVSAQETPSDFGLFEWIQDGPDGYFNPKQEYRYETPGDSSTVPGMYAAEVIKAGEILLRVPWDRILFSDDPDEDGQLCCGTVRALAREMGEGADSGWAPYVEYLNAQPDDVIPSGWAEEAQLLLRRVVGGTNHVDGGEIGPDEPTEWIELDWYDVCDGDRDDGLSAKAALLAVQHADGEKMVPVYGMYNHRNGRFFNTESVTTKGRYHTTRASRNIQPGEQIYVSHNHCEECGAWKKRYGTAGKPIVHAAQDALRCVAGWVPPTPAHLPNRPSPLHEKT